MGAPAELVGKRFGNLTVVELVGSHASNLGRIWRCRCKCGNKLTRTTAQLNQVVSKGYNLSCGDCRAGFHQRNVERRFDEYLQQWNSFESLYSPYELLAITQDIQEESGLPLSDDFIASFETVDIDPPDDTYEIPPTLFLE